MDFEHFAPARDFIYLSALFLGAGCGCMLNRFRVIATTRFRSSSITAGLCFFSGSVAALTASVIFSNWTILRETELYLPLVITALVVIAAFRFPRAAGFPLFLVCGFLAVAVGYISLSFPAIDDSDRVLVSREGNTLIHIYPVPHLNNADSSPEEEGAHLISFQSSGGVLEFHACYSAFSRIIPLVGGVDHGVIAEIFGNDELLYTNNRPPWRFLGNLYSKANNHEKIFGAVSAVFSFWEIRKSLELTELPSGTGLTVLFDGTGLAFR